MSKYQARFILLVLLTIIVVLWISTLGFTSFGQFLFFLFVAGGGIGIFIGTVLFISYLFRKAFP